MIPILYDSTATTFTTNGLGALSDALSCVVDEERNGAYELTMEYPVDGLHYADISLSCIIKAYCGQARSYQPFRIYKITRPMSGRVTIYAHHISYQLSYIPCAPFTATTVATALAGLKSNAAEACPFTFTTNKDTVANYTQTMPESIRSRLGGVQGSILDVYGGEFEFDNYTVRLWGNRGADRGVTLRYGKNLSSLTQETAIEETITGVYPYWTDEHTTVELPEKVISAASASSYPFHRTIALDCSEEFEEQPTVAQLRAYANRYISKAGIGVPKVAIEVSFVNLRDTEEYADVAALETVELCDTVRVIFDKLGVNATAKVVSTQWDVLAERYVTINIGDLRSSLAQTITTASEEAAQAVTTSALESAVQKATDLISGVSGGFVKFNYDADGKPYELLIMDAETEATATNIWRYNKNGWGFSGNGGASYTMAATIDGGIVADYIKAGTLTGLEINNGNGTFRVTSAGALTATSATINGDITSGSTITGSTISGGTISGTTITGGTVTGATINNGNGTFTVDSNGSVVANSLTSNNATITGGRINIASTSATADTITLTYSNGTITNTTRIGNGYASFSRTDDGYGTVSGGKITLTDGSTSGYIAHYNHDGWNVSDESHVVRARLISTASDGAQVIVQQGAQKPYASLSEAGLNVYDGTTSAGSYVFVGRSSTGGSITISDANGNVTDTYGGAAVSYTNVTFNTSTSSQSGAVRKYGRLAQMHFYVALSSATTATTDIEVTIPNAIKSVAERRFPVLRATSPYPVVGSMMINNSNTAHVYLQSGVSSFVCNGVYMTSAT